jgi:hypothetical protein
MKINLTKKQFCVLAEALEHATVPFALIREKTMDNETYKMYDQKLQQLEALKKDVFAHAKDFGAEEMFEVDRGRKIISDKYYVEHIDSVVGDYADLAAFTTLIGKLALRDVLEQAVPQEINDEYIQTQADKLKEAEEKYAQEFNDNGYNNLYIINMPRKNPLPL